MITVAARSSPLSKAQILEIEKELEKLSIPITLKTTFVESSGDKDLTTSLRSLGKTDFFTKELDDLVLSHQCRMAIHSAKDLPEPLPRGLRIVAITQGLDPADVLVLRSNETLASLREGAIIATSSERREQAVRQLRQDLNFIDLRGTIGQRLAKLETGEADGVVVAEAALIRLQLTHLNRVRLPGETVTHQGQLAIVARDDDVELRELLAPLDSRPTLCLGIEVPLKYQTRKILHHPIIQIEPRSPEELDIQSAFKQLSKATHLVFTSKIGVKQFVQQLVHFGHTQKELMQKHLLAVGNGTAHCIKSYGLHVDLIAKREDAEGIVEEWEKQGLKNRDDVLIFWPHSALSRSVLTDYLKKEAIPYVECILYDTKPRADFPKLALEDFAEILFTSPSTVDAFIERFKSIPEDLWCTPIGDVTKERLGRREGKR